MAISKEAKLDFHFKLDPKINFIWSFNTIKVLKIIMLNNLVTKFLNPQS